VKQIALEGGSRPPSNPSSGFGQRLGGPGGCERGWEVRWRVHGEVGQHLGVAAADHEPAECVAVVDALGSPATLPGGNLQRIASRRDVTALWSGEEIEVFRGPRREVLRKQSCSPSQQETLARGQREEQPGDLKLEVRQVRRAICHAFVPQALRGVMPPRHGTPVLQAPMLTVSPAEGPTGTTVPRPAPQQDCLATFGNSDIFGAAVSP
jgi:hypothetical protein